jgi:hypothetical protein
MVANETAADKSATVEPFLSAATHAGRTCSTGGSAMTLKQRFGVAVAAALAVGLIGSISAGLLALDANAGAERSSGLVAYVRYPGEKGGISVVPAAGAGADR